MSFANVTWKPKFAYLDKLHDQRVYDSIVDIYTDEGFVFIEFPTACVRVPANWNPPCDIMVGDVCLAYYDHDQQFRFALQD